MATAVFRYPLDVTGENPDNYVAAEPHSLVPKSDLTDVRVIVPLYGPFFGDSVRIIDRANGRQLDRSEYKITDLLQDPTLITGKEIGQFIVVTNGMVSNEVAIHYQVLGGNYQNDSSAIKHVYETFLNDYRPVDWTNISGKPLSYPPSLHIHLLEDVIGFGPLVTAIENLREAIILKNIPMYESLIDWVNQRTTDWSKITNRPTSFEDLGLTDVVPIARRVNAGAGLTGGGSLVNDVTIALPDTGVVASTFGSSSTIPVFRTDAKGRIVQATEVSAVIDWRTLTNKPTKMSELGVTDIVHNLRRINTTEGIKGGGDLRNDLTLSLTDTGVTQGIYGNSNTIPSFTVDPKGRIINATEVAAVIDWRTLTNRPTTTAALGVTDVVNHLRRINTSNGIEGGGDLRQDLNLRLTDTGVAQGEYGDSNKIPVIRTDAKGRIIQASEVAAVIDWRTLTNRPTTTATLGVTDVVNHLRRISTAEGIKGGGDLRNDLTLSLTDTGVVQGVYGDSNTIPSFTVDIKGRIVSAQRISLNLDWGRITGKPTTLAGYGITNAVDIASIQRITGRKEFDNVQLGHGSTAANPDNAVQSRVATEDWVNRLINSKIGGSSVVNGVAVMTMGSLTVCSGYGGVSTEQIYLPKRYTGGAVLMDTAETTYVRDAGGDSQSGQTYRRYMTLRGTLVSEIVDYTYTVTGSVLPGRYTRAMGDVTQYTRVGPVTVRSVQTVREGYTDYDYSTTPFVVIGAT